MEKQDWGQDSGNDWKSGSRVQGMIGKAAPAQREPLKLSPGRIWEHPGAGDGITRKTKAALRGRDDPLGISLG